MADDEQGGGSGRVTRGEALLWALFLALGVHLFVNGVLPARELESGQRERLEDYQARNASLARRLEDLRVREQALDVDPHLVMRELIDRGFTPPGAIRVLEEAPVRSR